MQKFLRLFLVLISLTVLRCTGQVYCRLILYWNLSDAFSYEYEFCVDFHRGKVLFHQVISRVHIINMIYDCDVDFFIF